MPRVRIGDEWIEGEDVAFNTILESWNEYKLEDGTEVRLKVVVKRVVRTQRRNANGEPIYVVQSQNVLDTRVSDDLIEEPEDS